ncbi:MAG: Heparin-sulfate lyase precursor [Lentisphaerae bacterium ADurb.BinA184]|nr:MAG: Heparin-sulfate lyase precursor [Lentisphaerae bacterium ADurb.BinA184]
MLAYQRDRVIESQVLMDADALGAACRRPVERRDGRPAVRLDVAAPVSVTFVPPLTDLRPFDQIVMIYRTSGGPVSPTLGIELATRTAGLIAPDSFNSGHPPALTAEGDWERYPFPWENLLVFGMGELVYPVGQMTLALGAVSPGATLWLAELRVERRERARGPRLTDAGLGAELDGLDGPGLLAHLRRRQSPRHNFGQPVAPADAATLETANAICRHHINGYDVGDPVNWRLNPNGYLEWMHAFNRHGWMNALLAAYRATGDARYVRTLDDLWLSWLGDNPEPEGHNGGGDPAWETLSVAVRGCPTWLDAFFGLLDDPHFRDATRVEILKSLHGHAEHLLRYTGYANNWLIVESRLLFVLGVIFPEFRRASAWLETGRERLTRELERQVWPDGADWELSPGYHMMACSGFLVPFELARLNAIRLPDSFSSRLTATFDYVAGLSRPDGTLPSVNDSGGWRKRAGRSYLALGAEQFARPELTASPEGPYAGRSRAFPDAGIYVLASGTGSDALWSFLDGGPPGASHCHDDALQLEFFAYGRPFIVDPGITGYLSDAWTDYYRRTHAHNTVLVNGVGQTWAHMGLDSRTRSARGRVQAVFGDRMDWVRATYDQPYDGQPEGLSHTRALLFVRGRYWVVFDEVKGAAAREMEARFQFVPMRLTLDRRRRVFRTLRQSLANLELWPLAPAGRLKLSVATGETAPVGGWVSDGEDQPAPQARIRLTGDVPGEPLRLVTVVYPFSQGVNSGMHARLRRSRVDEAVVEVELRRASGAPDRITYAWSDGRIARNGEPSDWADGRL